MKLIYREENILNIPNLLSFYRLIIFPLILYFAISNNEKLFVIFICISLITDVLDGFIARNFNMQTNFGLQLDNLADVATIITAFYGLFRFKWEDFQDHVWVIYLFVAIFIISYIISFIRFRKIPGLHLYGSVTSAYIMSIFFFVLFAWGFILWFYYLAFISGILAYIEKILILFKLKEIRPRSKRLILVTKRR